MTGIILALTGLFRLGYLTNFLSGPVVSGFTSGLAVIIIMVQMGLIVSTSPNSSTSPITIINTFIDQLKHTNLPSVTLGVGGIVFILFFRKLKKSVPWALMAIVISIFLVYYFDLHKLGVAIVGEVPSGLPGFSIPNLKDDMLSELFPLAFTIAILSFVGSISMAKAIHERHKDYKLIPNQELLAFGLSNMLGAFFQSLPVGGGLSRTVVNSDSGASTGMAGIISALLIAMTLIFLTPVFYYLPKPILGAIIIAAAIGLIDVRNLIHLWNTDRTDAWMYIATFLGTLFLGVEEGVFIGVSLSLGAVIYKTSRPHMAILGRIRGSRVYKNIERYEEAETEEGIMVFRFDDRLYFANVNALKEKVMPLLEKSNKDLKLFILDAQSMSDVDSSGVKLMFEILQYCTKNDICFVLSSVIGPVRDKLYKSGFVDDIGEAHFHDRIHEAITWFNSGKLRTSGQNPSRFQTNIN